MSKLGAVVEAVEKHGRFVLEQGGGRCTPDLAKAFRVTTRETEHRRAVRRKTRPKHQQRRFDIHRLLDQGGQQGYLAQQRRQSRIRHIHRLRLKVSELMLQGNGFAAAVEAWVARHELADEQLDRAGAREFGCVPRAA